MRQDLGNDLRLLDAGDDLEPAAAISAFVQSRLDEDIRRLHNPTSDKTIQLFRDYTGVDLTDRWYWNNFDKKDVRDRLNQYIKLRGDVVHRSRTIGPGPPKAQRIRSSEYFQRYFTYSIPPGDIGDAEVEEFLAELTASQTAPERIDEKLRGFYERRAMPSLVTKLRSREETLAPFLARLLAMAFARNGSSFPSEEGMYSMGGTRTQGAILISQLAKLFSFGAERDAFLAGLFEIASPLPFAADCFRWIRRASDESKEQHIVSEDGEVAARRVLSGRIRDSAFHAPLYREFGQESPHLLWIWAGGRGQSEVADFIRRWLESSDEEVDFFLDSYVGKAWGMESGLSHRSDFRREAYNSAAEMIDPEFVLGKLRSRYGSQLGNPQFHHGHDVSLATRIAHQFAFIHRAVIEEQRQASQLADSNATKSTIAGTAANAERTLDSEDP